MYNVVSILPWRTGWDVFSVYVSISIYDVKEYRNLRFIGDRKAVYRQKTVTLLDSTTVNCFIYHINNIRCELLENKNARKIVRK